jgi:hypothetical protein
MEQRIHGHFREARHFCGQNSKNLPSIYTIYLYQSNIFGGVVHP